MGSFLFNPAVAVPLGAFCVAIVGIISGSVSQAHSRRVKAEERMALIARGIAPVEIEKMMGADRNSDEQLPRSPTGRMRGSRTTSLILIGVGLGLAAFGAMLASIEHDREVLVVAAVGIIPLAIGLAFFVDYRLQKAEIERGHGA